MLAPTDTSSGLEGLVFLAGLGYGLVVSKRRWNTVAVAVFVFIGSIALVGILGYFVHISAEAVGFLGASFGLPFAGIAAAFHGYKNQKATKA